MTFQQTLDMIRDTAKAVNPTGSFVHGRNSDAANAAGEDTDYPRIHLYPFTQDIDPIETHKRKSDLMLSFVSLDSGDQDDDERETIIADAGNLVDSFLDRLVEDYDSSVQFDSIRTEPQYQVLEGVSGYTLSLKISSLVSC